MIFKLHFWFLTSGACAQTILLGVFIKHYTDASNLEVGGLFTSMFFIQLFTKPFICSLADRKQAHRQYIIICLFVLASGYTPYVMIPLLGEKVYEAHPRLCWYTFALLKIIGDIGYGGALSIGDTMAINYAKRIGVQFNRIRMWGAISWLVFGVLIGQINEVPFLPKYTPGFMILITASLLNMSIFWLWPDEYFRIVTTSQDDLTESVQKEKGPLMPRDQVLAHMRNKISSLFTCGCRRTLSTDNNEIVVQDSSTKRDMNAESRKAAQLPKLIQLKILAVLFKRDLRIGPYLLFFIMCGVALARNSFFFIGLEEKCLLEQSCQFSSIAGYVQTTTAMMETLAFYYIQPFMRVFGIVNTCTMLLLSSAVKNLFYGTIWINANPYWALLTELFQGLVYTIANSLSVEMGYRFSNEVQFIVPELIERQILSGDEDLEVVKGSVAATMQGIVSSFMEGLGRGLGALVFGIIIDTYSFGHLWFGCGVVFSVFALIAIAINIFDSVFQLRLGITQRANKLENK